MNKKQFAECLALVATSVDKPVSKEQAEVFWAALQDLPLETLRIACKAFVASNQYKSLPTPGQLRQHALEAVEGQSSLTPAQAWEIARTVAAKVDPSHAGPWMKKVDGEWKMFSSQTAAAMHGVPAIVARTINHFGVRALCKKDDESFIRTLFLKAFEANVERHRKMAMLPAPLKAEIAALPANVAQTIGQIGLVEGGK